MSKALADVENIEEGSSIVVTSSEGREIALFKSQGTIYALENVCPHMEGPLGEGDLEEGIVTCPWHGWQFHVHNGACVNMPGEKANKIPIEIREGKVYLAELS